MNVLLGVCGSISAYKTYDLARNLVKLGHNVRVILTSGAQKFIQPNTFNYLGVEEVYTSQDDFNLEKTLSNVLHIDLTNWCDIFVIAPASANTIAKLANGQCDDLLSSVFLTAEEKQKIIFPAMNTRMLNNTITQKNFERLNELNNIFIHPSARGLLACGDEGEGKLPGVTDISEFVDSYPLKKNNRVILITTGSTVAPIDPVRYITNPSSGKTGYELAKSYLKRGCHVRLVYGSLSTFPRNALKEHPHLELVPVHTTQDMFEQVQKFFPTCDVFISSAAVSDIKVSTAKNKIKKSESSNSIHFEWAPDILASMVKQKSSNQKIISFAAETNDLDNNFSKKWNSKPVDLMIGNQVSNGFTSDKKGFGTDENKYYMVQDGKVQETLDLSKTGLSNYISTFTETHS